MRTVTVGAAGFRDRTGRLVVEGPSRRPPVTRDGDVTSATAAVLRDGSGTTIEAIQAEAAPCGLRCRDGGIPGCPCGPGGIDVPQIAEEGTA